MSNQAGSVIFIILCPIVLWLSIILVPYNVEHNHQSLSDTNEQLPPQVGGYILSRHVNPPLSPSILSNYFQAKPRSLSRVETLFYDFDATVPVGNELDSINKTQHEKASLKLNEITKALDSVVKEDGDKLFAFNMLASNRIGCLRPLPDTRPVKCPKVETALDAHIGQLPSQQVSIIICYYNEAPSALLRTIYSILKRSRHELIKEILIIDDHSEHGYDLNHIEPHLSSVSQLVKLVRTPKREGLIRARQFGADIATGEVFIFLDSHVEANVGWLEPLIETIRNNQTTIACPMIDLINAETMIYSASPMVRGGLTWSLHFKWDSVPSDDLRTAEDFAKAIESPTMAGGLYAISREYFYHLGAYDSGMNLWGGENVELSMRTWMCGGKIVILPCSRLGHIFRKRRPYGPAPGQPDSLLYNSHRTARVWLDDYIAKFYGQQPDAASLDSGDVVERVQLRQRLKCNDFDWFMDNVYPKLRLELKPPPPSSDSNDAEEEVDEEVDDDDEQEDEEEQEQDQEQEQTLPANRRESFNV